MNSDTLKHALTMMELRTELTGFQESERVVFTVDGQPVELVRTHVVEHRVVRIEFRSSPDTASPLAKTNVDMRRPSQGQEAG